MTILFDYRACPGSSQASLKLPPVVTRYDNLGDQETQTAQADLKATGFAIRDLEPGTDQTQPDGTPIPFLTRYAKSRKGTLVNAQPVDLVAAGNYWRTKVAQGWEFWDTPFTQPSADYSWSDPSVWADFLEDARLEASILGGAKHLWPGVYWQHTSPTYWLQSWGLTCFLRDRFYPNAELIPYVMPIWCTTYDTPQDNSYIGDDRMSMTLDFIATRCSRFVLWMNGVPFDDPRTAATVALLKKRGLLA